LTPDGKLSARLNRVPGRHWKSGQQVSIILCSPEPPTPIPGRNLPQRFDGLGAPTPGPFWHCVLSAAVRASASGLNAAPEEIGREWALAPRRECCALSRQAQTCEEQMMKRVGSNQRTCPADPPHWTTSFAHKKRRDKAKIYGPSSASPIASCSCGDHLAPACARRGHFLRCPFIIS
jgi:hypothetical protein